MAHPTVHKWGVFSYRKLSETDMDPIQFLHDRVTDENCYTEIDPNRECSSAIC